MAGFFEKIKGASRRERMRYVVVFSAVAGVFVVLVWIATLRQIRTAFSAPAGTPAKPTFSLIGQSAGQAFSDLKFGFGNVFRFFHTDVFSNKIELNATTTP
jgi:hypothetical protein